MYNAERWKNLEIWRLSDKLAHEVYRLAKSFPKEELYGITSQLIPFIFFKRPGVHKRRGG